MLGLVHFVEMRLIGCWMDLWLLEMAERLNSLLGGSNEVKLFLGFGAECVFQLC